MELFFWKKDTHVFITAVKLGVICLHYLPSDRPLGFVWLEEWKSRRIENCERMEKWEDRKYLVFPLMCLVGGVEKWDDGKLFCLVGEKKERMENVIYVN